MLLLPALSPRPQQADDCTLPSLTFLPILPTFLLRQPDAETEQVDQCSLPGLTRAPAAEPGLCRDIVLPYVERFCDTPFDQLGGKSELQVSLNIFACESAWKLASHHPPQRGNSCGSVRQWRVFNLSNSKQCLGCAGRGTGLDKSRHSACLSPRVAPLRPGAFPQGSCCAPATARLRCLPSTTTPPGAACLSTVRRCTRWRWPALMNMRTTLRGGLWLFSCIQAIHCPTRPPCPACMHQLEGGAGQALFVLFMQPRTNQLSYFRLPPLSLRPAAYQLVGGVLEDMLMQVALQHAAPNYLRYADACVSSGDAAEQVRILQGPGLCLRLGNLTSTGTFLLKCSQGGAHFVWGC